MNNSAVSPKLFPLFLFLAALFLLLRLTPLFTATERIFRYDELDIGAIAKELLQGPTLPLWAYQMDPYGGESLALGILSIPFVKLFGLNLLAIKMPAFLLSFCTFIFMFFFMARHFGKSNAVWTALLLIFCPPSFVQFSLSGLCGHTGVLFFSAGMLYFFYNFLYGGKRSFLPAFLCGLFGGAGFWFDHGSLLMTLTCLLCWGILDRASLRSRLFPGFLAGLAAGLLPWLEYNRHLGPMEASFFSRTFFSISEPWLYWEVLLKKLIRLFLTGIPFSFNFFPVFGIHERLISFVIFALACVPVFPAIFVKTWQILRTKKDPEKIFPFLLFPFVFLIFFAFLPFDLTPFIGFAGYRYLSALQFFALPLAPLLLPPGKAKNILLCSFMAVNLVGQSALAFQEPFGRALLYKSHSYYLAGPAWRSFFEKTVKTPEAFLKGPVQWDSTQGYFLLWDIANAGIMSGSNALASETSLYLEDVINALPPGSSPYLYEWKGRLIQDFKEAEQSAAFLKDPEKQMLYKGFFENWDGFSIPFFLNCPECYDTGEAGGEWAYRTLGKFLYWDFHRDRYLNFNFALPGDIKKMGAEKAVQKVKDLSLPPEKEALIYQGMAMAHFEISAESNILLDRSVERLLDAMPPEKRKHFYWGIGWNARQMFREDRKRALDRLDLIPREEKEEALKGVAAFENAYGVPS